MDELWQLVRDPTDMANSFCHPRLKYFYCKQCKKKMSAGKEEDGLGRHFESTYHTPVGVCSDCSQPMYEYECDGKTKVYRKCSHR